jgi:NAD(P)-dependent dehydrogenase (short-subunit alcohol dehydrogenase family)
VELGIAGRRAVVTGGSKGLGFAIARELLDEGVKVAICSRSEQEIAAAAEELSSGRSGATVYAQRADVTNVEEVSDFVARSVAALGGLDFLVNNAGRAHPGNFAGLSDEDWQSDLDVKLFSLIRCCREVLPHMRDAGGGRIVNISAIFGRYPDPAFFATSVNRAAGLSFTKTLAMEVATDNVLVNSVNVGFVVTPQWENIHRRRAPEMEREEFFSTLAATEVPLGRFGTPEEVSGVVTFLLSERAGYITGASIDVAGGMGKYV